METKKYRVCVIGAGPSGMSALFHFGQLDEDEQPEVVCYEKQSTWGGLWNFTWRTGTDEYGEPCHNGMYKHLWHNAPKECLEIPNYTFEEHFGKPMPSYLPRPLIRDYLEGRWLRKSTSYLRNFIKFHHVVRSVRYNADTDNFVVTVSDQEADVTRDEIFSHVIVAVGIFNVPNTPDIPGVDTFNGRVLHSHDYRDASEFKGLRILAIGASYSAEDVALQGVKFGSKSIICSWRTKPMGYKWPKGVEEKPLVQKMEGNVAHFRDGSRAEVDAIILCTGYRCHFPFMEDGLRLRTKRSFYPGNLYKGTVWTKGGNNKLMYLGAQDQYFSFSMFDVQAMWAVRYIIGKLPNEPQPAANMEADVERWVKRNNSLKNRHEEIDFQSDFVADLAKVTGYDKNAPKAGEYYKVWLTHKEENVATYRDQSFPCIYTGTKSPKAGPWMEAFDDSLKAFGQ